MGELLFDLEQILRSKQERLTPQESNVLMTCKSKAIREFTGGALGASVVVWAATRRLSKLLRFNLSGGAGAFFGLWRFSRSLDSCVNHILELDESRMQKELATLIVNKYRNDPWGMQLISKHFYSEEVFDDATVDQPKLRWRYRNFFSDGVAHGQGTHESDSHHTTNSNSDNNMHSDLHNEPDSKNTDSESKQIPKNTGIAVLADPFVSVFGDPTTREETQEPNASSTSPRILTRGHRRSHRRHRRRNQEEVSLSPQRV